MNRLASVFARLAASGRKALIPYVTAGFPHPELAQAVLRALVEGGADIIELGVPFSDPVADGPVIQRAGEQAIAHGVGLRQVLDIVRAFRRDDAHTPLVLMSYANPLERFGVPAFVEQAADAGVDGVLVVDYPPEESSDFVALARGRGIDTIFLIAPTSTDARIDQVLAMASGYVYCVSMTGTTGGRLDAAAVAGRIAAIRARAGLPVGVGFGIRDGATARAVAQNADAVIIGTRLIEVLAEEPSGQAAPRARRFIAAIRAALDEGPDAAVDADGATGRTGVAGAAPATRALGSATEASS